MRPSKSGAPGEVVSEARGPTTTPGLPPDVVVAATPNYRTGVARVLAKLGVRDRVHAVILANETGLVSPRGGGRRA